MNYILDAIVLAVVCFLAWRCSKKGFVKTAVLLFGFIIAAIVAKTVSTPISTAVYDGFVSEKVTAAVEEAVGAGTEQVGDNIENAVEEALGALPAGLQNITKFFITEDQAVEQNIAESIKNSTEGISETIEQNIIRPAVTGLLQMIVFVLLFILLSFLIRRLAFIGGLFNKIPLVGKVNMFLGGVVGAVEGIIIVFLFATVAAFVVMLMGEKSPIAAEDIEKTYLFRFFYDNNPLINIK